MSVKFEKVEDELKVEKKMEQPQEAVKPVVQVVPEAPMGFYPITDLPSKYKLYPEGTLIYGRPLRVLEVKQLAQMGEQNSTIVMNNVLKSATKGIRIEELLVADKIYILFWLRANTYKDSGYQIDFKCLKCDKDSTYAFNLDSLDINYIPDNYVEGKPIELPISKDKVVMRYQRVCDVTEYQNFKDKILGNKLEEYNDEILGTASCIVSVNGAELPLKKRYEYLINLQAGDFTVIENNSILSDIGVSTLINVKCSLCNEMSYAGLSFRPEFFIPPYKT